MALYHYSLTVTHSLQPSWPAHECIRCYVSAYGGKPGHDDRATDESMSQGAPKEPKAVLELHCPVRWGAFRSYGSSCITVARTSSSTRNRKSVSHADAMSLLLAMTVFDVSSFNDSGYWFAVRSSQLVLLADASCHYRTMSTQRDSSILGAAPNAATLHDAALDYLARYAATEAGLRRVLERRVDRWARQATDADPEAAAAQANAARVVVREVVARLVAAGAVNDVAYAENRARSLVRSGRSRRAAGAHLVAKGVDPATVQSVLPENAQTELAAALVLARKRRIGPFRRGAVPDEAGRRRELGMLARAGFAQDVARQALAMEADQAETLVNEFRR